MTPSPAACATPLDARDAESGACPPASGSALKQPSASGAGEAPGLAVTTR